MKAAEKEMEARRQDALKDAMEKQVNAMGNLTTGLSDLNNTLTRVLDTRPTTRPGIANTAINPIFSFAYIAD